MLALWHPAISLDLEASLCRGTGLSSTAPSCPAPPSTNLDKYSLRRSDYSLYRSVFFFLYLFHIKENNARYMTKKQVETEMPTALLCAGVFSRQALGFADPWFCGAVPLWILCLSGALCTSILMNTAFFRFDISISLFSINKQHF